MARSRPAVAVLLALALAACGTGDDPADGTATPPPSGGSADIVLVIVDGEPGGPGISVAEALEHQPTDDIVAVTGALFVDPDGTVRLCDAIAESFPPQCGGARILVDGLDLASVPGLQAEGEVSWADSVTLLGSVE
jgi:hypothetical protein